MIRKCTNGRTDSARLVLGLLATIPALLMGARPAAALTLVTMPGQTLNIPNEQYVLANDLVVPPGGVGVNIVADGIEFDGNGHTISGPGDVWVPKTIGVQVNGANGVRIHNVNVRGFSVGFRIMLTKQTRIYQVRGLECVEGILFYEAHGCSVVGSRFSDNHWGCYLANSTGNTFTQNWVTDNTRLFPAPNPGFSGGFYLGSADGNSIRGNTILRNGGVGVWCYFDADNNQIISNIIADGQGYGFTTYAAGNQILANRIVRNKYGVALAPGAAGNVVQRNEVFENTVLDMEDSNLPALVNTWTLNAFMSDNEAGADYGPGVGWIQ